MNPSPFPVQRSLLSASALAEWVGSNYELTDPLACQFWRRSINDTYLVKAGETQLVLRICPTGWRSYEHLAGELDLLNFLHCNHISVPRPVPRNDDAYIQTFNAPEGSRYAVLFTFVPGEPLDPTPAHSRRYGQAIAQLHNATDDYPADRAGFRFGLTEMVDASLARLRPLFVDHQDDFDYLLEMSADLRQTAGRLPRQSPEYGICHGDVNHGNFHLIDDHRWALLDFEYFGYGWRVFDVATFVDNQIYQLGRTEQADNILDAFLNGYQSLRPLSQTELDVLPSFVMLRQLWLLGTGARCYPNVGWSLFQHWVFDRVMPLIRNWMAEPWKPSGHTPGAGAKS